MSEATELCLGCYRTIEEIREWWELSAEERKQVLANIDLRQAQAFSD